MSGFGDSHGESNARYANIISGKFAEKVDEDTPGAKSRLNKNNQTVYELLHPSIEGRIKKCMIQDTEYGKNLRIVFDCDEHGTIVVTFQVESRYFDSFMYRFPNIAIKGLDKLIKLTPFDFTDKDSGTKRQGISVEVNGEKIGPFYTRENPGSKPTDDSYDKDANGRLDEADFKHFKSKERKFFCDMIAKAFPNGENEKYTGAIVSEEKAPVTNQNNKPAVTPKPKPQQPVDDDLPF